MTTVLSTTRAVSPFDDSGVQFAWDSTSLGWLKECPRKYFLSMIEGWRSKHEAIDLVFGIWYHDGLEFYDKCRAEGQDHQMAVRGVVRRLLDATWIRAVEGGEPSSEPVPAGKPWSHENTKKKAKSRFGLIRSVVWYLEEFGENDPASTIILANGKPAVELSFRFEVDQGIVLCGHLDRVVSYGGESFVMDRKTTSGQLGPYYFDQYSPHNQMTLYTVAAQVAFAAPVKGVIIDAVQVMDGFSRYMRSPIYRTARQLDEYLEGVYTLRETARVYTERAHWPMNETACDKFGGCVFRRDVCSKDPAIRPAFLKTHFTQEKRWNPLTPR